jgi:uncharacterized protein YcnI
VPSEEQLATTVRLSVTVPKDVTIDQITSTAGFMAVKATDSAGDTVITWTATGTGIAPAQATDLVATAGALPDRPTVSFDAVQTYSNGDMVYWNQQQTGQTEPPFPEPTLKLAGSTAGAQPDRASLGPAAESQTPAPAPSASAASTDRATVTVGQQPNSAPGEPWGPAVVGGILGAAGVAAVMVIRRRRLPAGNDKPTTKS